MPLIRKTEVTPCSSNINIFLGYAATIWRLLGVTRVVLEHHVEKHEVLYSVRRRRLERFVLRDASVEFLKFARIRILINSLIASMDFFSMFIEFVNLDRVPKSLNKRCVIIDSQRFCFPKHCYMRIETRNMIDTGPLQTCEALFACRSVAVIEHVCVPTCIVATCQNGFR